MNIDNGVADVGDGIATVGVGLYDFYSFNAEVEWECEADALNRNIQACFLRRISCYLSYCPILEWGEVKQ